MDLDYVNKFFFFKYRIKMSIVMIIYIGNVIQNVFVCRRESISIGQQVWISRYHHQLKPMDL